MSDVKTSLLAAGGVAAAAIAVVLGSRHRDRLDFSDSARVSLGSMLASNERQSSVPATDYFRSLSDKLKREYVEPVNDDMKLALGSVRGMVASLADPKSLYMDKEEFEAYRNSMEGTYEGIGVDFALLSVGNNGRPTQDVLQPTASEDQVGMAGTDASLRVPRLTVVSVVPGGPADRAGVKAGDIVDSVDGHWVFNSDLILRFRAAQRRYQAKQMTLAQINDLRNQLRVKYDKAILPLRARDRLFIGESGKLKVVWQRGTAYRTTEITRGVSKRATFQSTGNTIRLNFVKDAAAKLSAAIAGKDAVTLDLRQNVNGDFKVMKACLAAIAPSGEYGYLASERKSAPDPFRIVNGNAKPPKVTLLTDSTTRGAAEIFALALSSRGRAKLEGSVTGGDRSVVELVALPEGTGYTLVTAEYRATAAAPRPRQAAATGGRAR